MRRARGGGRDSAGVAVLADGGLAAAKKAGKLVHLEKELGDRPLPAGRTGIGHTRWATHRAPTDGNAHPHLDNAGRVAVVHNGIIENFAALRRELTGRGHALESETDTEVLDQRTLVVAVSQSGETMDTLMALRHAREQGAKVLAVCNTNGSTIPRESEHGPIALVEKGLPVVVIVPSPRGRSVLHDKIVSNIQEIRARGALTVVVAEEGDEAVVPYADHLITVPATPTLLQPLVATVPLQVFACELATARGNEVDQPRNLAKSVTVE